MEKLNEEKLAKEATNKAKLFAPKGEEISFTLGYINGSQNTEAHYLKIIEEKNTIHEWDDKAIQLLKNELQQAKDLLKELKGNLIYINEESMNIGCEEEIKKIEEFLNK